VTDHKEPSGPAVIVTYVCKIFYNLYLDPRHAQLIMVIILVWTHCQHQWIF